MSKVACVFGSTGLIGAYLLDILLNDKRYTKIIVFNRSKQELADAKIHQIIGNYSDLETYSDQLLADEYYCCLGTTMNKANSKEAFEFVDYHLPLVIGKIAVANKVNTYLVVSSIGASPKSGNYYLSVKGKMEKALQNLGLKRLMIFRPSMLLGDRKETRLLETISKPFFILLGIFLVGSLKKYKAIHGRKVAGAMVICANALLENAIFESDEIAIIAG